MNKSKVEKVQFASQLSGSALLKVERVTFQLSGLITGGSRTYYASVSVPDQRKYFSDASFHTNGTLNTNTRIYKQAPRSQYLITEATFPTPRFYINKRNHRDSVEVSLSLTNVTSSSFTLAGNYTVYVDVFIFGSNQTY